MHTDLTGNPTVLKMVNRIRVMKILFRNSALSRAELARRSGLDAKTITNITSLLIEEGVLQARNGNDGDRAAPATRGRPAEQLILNPDAAYAIGLDLGATHMTLVTLDLLGSVRRIRTIELSPPPEAGDTIRLAIAELSAAVNELGSRRPALTGAGVCLPGILNRQDGTVVKAANLRGFDGRRLHSELEAAIGIPVEIEDSSRALAAAEIWFGRNDVENCIVLDLGYGIGMGIIHDGLIYRGWHQAAGELGHTIVRPRGVRCTCGKSGCLETVASGRALDAAAPDHPPGHGARELHRRAIDGDRRARGMLAAAGRYIGIAAANASALLDPACIVTGGGLARAGEYLLDPMREAFSTHALTHGRGLPQIVPSELGPEAGARGAAMLCLKRFFEFENIRL